MFNELEELNNLNTIEEMNNYIEKNKEDLEKLDLNQRQQFVDTYLDKTMYEIQTNYMNNELSKVVNAGLDIGLRIILPDYIDEEVIQIKNNLLNYGFKDGLSKTVEEAIDFGKQTLGILTNNFESITDARNAIKTGGTLDKISDLLDKGVDALKDKKIINSTEAKNIKKEKNTIVKNIEENIDKSFEEQVSNFEKLEKYMTNWKEGFNSQDFSLMQKEYNKMVKVMDSLMPLENTLSEFRTIENLQSLIKNNGKNFDLSPEELELANKLIQ